MIFDEPGNNLALAIRHVYSLRRFPNPMGFGGNASQMSGDFGPTFSERFFPATDLYPAAWYGGDNRKKILYIDGVRTLAQATALMNGYDNGTGPTGTNGYNPYLQNAAVHYGSLIFGPHLHVPEYIDLVGYSCGGAIAVAMGARFVQTQSVIKTRAITFGAPRTAGPTMITHLQRYSVTRWMMETDPVPLLPPSFADTPGAIFLTGLRTLQRYGSFRHTEGGIEIALSGNVEPQIIPRVASLNTSYSLASWVLGMDNNVVSGHSLHTYLDSLELALDQRTIPSQQNVREAGVEPEHAPHRRDANQGQERTRAAIANAGALQNNVPLDVPRANLFKAERIGRTWVVTFGGELILVSGREDRARSIARSGNDFLRKLPKQALVDPVSLGSQFQTFLEVAVRPDGPVHPPIRVALPG